MGGFFYYFTLDTLPDPSPKGFFQMSKPLHYVATPIIIYKKNLFKSHICNYFGTIVELLLLLSLLFILTLTTTTTTTHVPNLHQITIL